MYIQQILSLIAFLLYTGDTLECKNKEYICCFVWAWGREKKNPINQPCLVNSLRPRLRDAAFVFKLRPLGNNPVEHTGLEFAQRRLNTESRLRVCRLPPASHSLFVYPSVKCHHRCKQGQSLPYIHTGSGYKCFFLASMVQV